MPKVFKYITPLIPSAGVYYFTTDADILYEVRFGRKQSDILSVNIVFGVLNDEFDGEEYTLTNKGEFYSVMVTILEIIKHFKSQNKNVHHYEFSGEPTQKYELNSGPTKRTKIYLRWAKRVFPENEWNHSLEGNKVVIERLKQNL